MHRQATNFIGFVASNSTLGADTWRRCLPPHTPIIAARDAGKQCGIARAGCVKLHHNAAVGLLADSSRDGRAIEIANDGAARRISHADRQPLVTHCARRGTEGSVEAGRCRYNGSGHIVWAPRQREQGSQGCDDQDSLQGYPGSSTWIFLSYARLVRYECFDSEPFAANRTIPSCPDRP